MINEVKKLVDDLTAIEERIAKLGNTTVYKGPFIDAQRQIFNSKNALRNFIRAEKARQNS